MATKKGKKQDGRSTDLTFSWMLTTLGPEWQQWQEYAAEWMREQSTAINLKLRTLSHFFESYLFQYASYASDVTLFFNGFQGHLCSSEEFEGALKKTISIQSAIAESINYSFDFIDFLIERHGSEEDDNGRLIPVFQNPLSKIKRQPQLTETVRNPLPYRYIQDLRQILCSMPDKAELADIQNKLTVGKHLLPAYRYRHFKNWIWAQQQTGDGSKSGDWFEVEPELIDTTDPDCVWRSKEIIRNNKNITIHQIWSPVKAMVVFVKLHLPLRTYQVRMLDSGEADTWRYENGSWCINKKHNFALGSEKHPFGKGVFRRKEDSFVGQIATGLYINTNKTADQNKEELELGYLIPWQHEELLYWLEKLRNWQEKYNPIERPVDCTTLLKKHTANQKSRRQLESMGEMHFCFGMHLQRGMTGQNQFRQTR